MSKIYLEILDGKRQKIFDKLSHFKRYGYLAGGTALSLQLNHRKSFYFDVFIKKPAGNYLRLKIKKIFGMNIPYVNTSDQISFNLKENIGVTFVWYYYHPISPLVKTGSISLASIQDIAADKAHTLGRRAVWRDYVDLFIFLKWKIFTLNQIVGLANKKFGNEFIELQFLEQLVYFGDVTVTPVEFLKDSYTPLEIKAFLEKAVEVYVKERLRI